MEIIQSILGSVLAFFAVFLPTNTHALLTPSPTIYRIPTLIPTPTIEVPTESSLKIAAFIAVEATDKQLEDLKARIGLPKESDRPTFVRSYALYLDKNTETKAMNQALIEKIIQKRGVPVVNNESPVINTNPVNNNSIHCTTNTIGSYTYTNCY